MFPLSHGRTYSLQRRLVLAFGVLLILFLGLTGFVLNRSFQQSVAASVEERLQLQIYALLGVAEPDQDGFFLPDLEEARFSQIDSGLYGFIFDGDGGEAWRSPSAINLDLDGSGLAMQPVEPGQTRYGRLDAPGLGRLSWASYGTYWAGQEEEYRFVVLESLAPAEAEIREFQSSLWFWLGGLALLLSLLQYGLLRWGLAPLQRLARDVARIESGDSEQLGEGYPRELQAVSQNLNLLIRSERERQARYRSTLGDLAHSLKTPLAVIAGLVEQTGGRGGDGEMREIGEQVERMNQIVSWQLRRAVKANARLLARPVPAVPVFEKVLGAMAKVYHDKGVTVEADLAPEASFQGEQSDLMEMAGNLLDNAFKYCRGRVALKLAGHGRRLLIEVGDDGPGIAEEHRRWVLERGARADTVKSGQGIGLAVVVELVSSYGGEIAIGESPLGGAEIRVII